MHKAPLFLLIMGSLLVSHRAQRIKPSTTYHGQKSVPMLVT